MRISDWSSDVCSSDLTTGLDPLAGHRIVEIGCIELANHMPTGRNYHQYVNPERDMPAGGFDVHGLSEAFLARHPVFAAVAADFLARSKERRAGKACVSTLRSRWAPHHKTKNTTTFCTI